jgi:hypothetical protein
VNDERVATASIPLERSTRLIFRSDSPSNSTLGAQIRTTRKKRSRNEYQGHRPRLSIVCDVKNRK